MKHYLKKIYKKLQNYMNGNSKGKPNHISYKYKNLKNYHK